MGEKKIFERLEGLIPERIKRLASKGKEVLEEVSDVLQKAATAEGTIGERLLTALEQHEKKMKVQDSGQIPISNEITAEPDSELVINRSTFENDPFTVKALVDGCTLVRVLDKESVVRAQNCVFKAYPADVNASQGSAKYLTDKPHNEKWSGKLYYLEPAEASVQTGQMGVRILNISTGYEEKKLDESSSIIVSDGGCITLEGCEIDGEKILAGCTKAARSRMAELLKLAELQPQYLDKKTDEYKKSRFLLVNMTDKKSNLYIE